MVYQDLLKDTSQVDTTDKNYFDLIITDLKLSTTYPLQFRWKYNDGTFSLWSPSRNITTPGPTVPGDPQLNDGAVVGGAGFISVTWTGKDASGNTPYGLDRVDVYIAGTTFGDGTKVAGSFKQAGTQTFAAEPGIYIVQLKAVTVNGATSFFSSAKTVTVTPTAGEAIESPIAPSSTGFTSARILGGIEVTWNGTYPTAWGGFSAINIYAGTSSTLTSGTYIKVGTMTANKISNTIVIPQDGTYVKYDTPVYIHASSVNKNNVESSIVANVTSQSLGARSAIASDLADQIITSGKLVDSAITEAKIATGAITTTKISDGSISTAKIISGAITSDLITASAITADKIAANAITATKISAGSIDVTKLAAGTISVNNLEAGLITSSTYVRAGTAGSARVEIASTTQGSILAGLYVYNSDSVAVLSAPLSGGLSITGALTATSISTSSNNFSVDTSGILKAVSADISGVVKANGGNIGGIVIASDAIQNGSTSGNSTFRLDSSGKARFGSASGNGIIINPSPASGGYYLYHTSDGSSYDSKFGVRDDGTLFAYGATVTGTIEGSSLYLNSSNYWRGNSGFQVSATTQSSTDIVETGSTYSSTSSAYAYSTITVSASEVAIYHLPALQNNVTVTNYISGSGDPSVTQYANYTSSASFGPYARQRTIVADPYDNNKLKKGMAVYYGQRSLTPSTSTGYVGDLWVSWA
jgi:hypothetical protein